MYCFIGNSGIVKVDYLSFFLLCYNLFYGLKMHVGLLRILICFSFFRFRASRGGGCQSGCATWPRVRCGPRHHCWMRVRAAWQDGPTGGRHVDGPLPRQPPPLPARQPAIRMAGIFWAGKIPLPKFSKITSLPLISLSLSSSSSLHANVCMYVFLLEWLHNRYWKPPFKKRRAI